MTTKGLLKLYPTPWKIAENLTKTRLVIVDGNNQPMMEIFPLKFSLEIGDFICKLVNVVEKILKIAEQ